MFFILFRRRLPEKGSCQSHTPIPIASLVMVCPSQLPLCAETSSLQINVNSQRQKLLKNCGKSLHDKDLNLLTNTRSNTLTHAHARTHTRMHTQTHRHTHACLASFLRSLYHNLLFMHFVYSMYICTVL